MKEIHRLTDLFHKLLDNVIDEIRLREPSYLSRFAVGLPSVEKVVEARQGHEIFNAYTSGQLHQAITEGASYLAGHGVKLDPKPGESDPVGQMLSDSILDAFAASHGHLALTPSPTESRPLADLLRQDYEERATAEGVRYFIRRRGSRLLVLVSAIGIPLAVWSRFLGDPRHDFRIMAVESRCGDMLEGGMKNASEIAQEAADISAALDRESAEDAVVMGWCNGGRLAIEAASLCRKRLRSVVLVSPALGGIKGVQPVPSRFEAGMKKVFSVLNMRPALARTYVKALNEEPPNWEALLEPAVRAATLFALPAQVYAAALRLPMSQAEFLVNYGRRLATDTAHPVDQALASLDQETLLITGSNDSTVNNDFVVSALRTWKPDVLHANTNASGHYVNDLQYPYFLSMLEDFLLKKTPPRPSARVEVKPLATTRQTKTATPGTTRTFECQ